MNFSIENKKKIKIFLNALKIVHTDPIIIANESGTYIYIRN